MQYVPRYRKSQKQMRKDDLLLDRASQYSNEQLSQLIDQHINGRNAERNRAILKRRLIDGICYEPLAEEFELSVRQTQNIVYKSMTRLLLFI